MSQENLIELVGCHFTLLKDVRLEKRAVNVFPLKTQLVGKVLVEGGCPLAIHAVQPERGL